MEPAPSKVIPTQFDEDEDVVSVISISSNTSNGTDTEINGDESGGSTGNDDYSNEDDRVLLQYMTDSLDAIFNKWASCHEHHADSEFRYGLVFAKYYNYKKRCLPLIPKYDKIASMVEYTERKMYEIKGELDYVSVWMCKTRESCAVLAMTGLWLVEDLKGKIAEDETGYGDDVDEDKDYGSTGDDEDANKYEWLYRSISEFRESMVDVFELCDKMLDHCSVKLHAYKSMEENLDNGNTIIETVEAESDFEGMLWTVENTSGNPKSVTKVYKSYRDKKYGNKSLSGGNKTNRQLIDGRCQRTRWAEPMHPCSHNEMLYYNPVKLLGKENMAT